MGALPEEILRVLFLDASRRLVADEQMQHGSVRQLALYPRTIFRRALDPDAAAILLVHTNPSGDPTPSDSDISVNALQHNTRRALAHDHITNIIVNPHDNLRLTPGQNP